tara:strand:+ start:3302 stop:3856 length:555 start_codon:yes stop_codon:yes gene_type:complete
MIKHCKNFVTKQELKDLEIYFDNCFFKQKIARADPMVKGSLSIYSDLVAQYFMCIKKPLVEKAFKTKLIPTYSFSRVYFKDNVMKRHSDRASCEISVSLNIWSDMQWPLWYETKKGNVPMYTKPGEAVLYEGQKYDHWREPFKGESCCQVFIHYIRANGKHKDKAYDGRENIKYPKLIMEPWLK